MKRNRFTKTQADKVIKQHEAVISMKELCNQCRHILQLEGRIWGYGLLPAQKIERNGSGTFPLQTDVCRIGPPELCTEGPYWKKALGRPIYCCALALRGTITVPRKRTMSDWWRNLTGWPKSIPHMVSGRCSWCCATRPSVETQTCVQGI